jgi:leader peptidase (prepilin peptidase)/N-methyltransferase
MSHSLSYREAIAHRADNFVFRSVGGPERGVLPGLSRGPQVYLPTPMTTLLFLPAIAGVTFVPAAAAAAVDWRTRRVPDLFVALALVPPLVAVVVAGDPRRLLASVALGAAVMALPLLIVHLVVPRAMGFGDVKLAAALGAALGVLEPELAMPALAVASGLTLLGARWTRRSALPFAPGLVAGAAAALAFGALRAWNVQA